MKNLLLVILLAISSTLIAQTSGTIIYDEITKMEIHLPPGFEAPVDFPSENIVTKALYFTENESLYKPIPQEEKVNAINTGDFHLEIKNEIPDDVYYKNLSKGLKTEKRDFLGRVFLMNGAIPEFKWKIAPEQKKILDYVVQKATTTIDTTEIIAWFTPQIQISNGPYKYGNLPGMILEIEDPQNNRVLVAKEITLGAPSEEIKPPKKGKKISEEAFKKIREEKLAEMEAEYGGKGGVFIQIDEEN